VSDDVKNNKRAGQIDRPFIQRRRIMELAKRFLFNDSMLEAFASVDDNYSYHIKPFIDFVFNRESVNGLELVREYFRELNNSTLSASTIQVRRAAVKNRLRYFIQGEAARAALDFQLQKVDKQIKPPSRGSQSIGADKIITQKEYNRLIDKARSDRQKRWIEMLFTTGIRISELTGILLSDCAISGRIVSIRIRGKGNKKAEYKERTIYITLAMYERIRITFEGSTYLFETSNGKRYSRSYISNQLGKLSMAVIGKRMGAHSYRHSWASLMVKTTGRINAISSYLGHSNPSTTVKYYIHDSFSPDDVLGPALVI